MACCSKSNSEIRNVIILGKTGSGKSTIINKVLGEKCVEAKFSFSGVTKEVKLISRLIQVDGLKYYVNFMDTVGLCDTKVVAKKDNEKIISDIKEALKTKFTGGVHLIIVTIDISRICEDDIDIIKLLDHNFKAMFWKISVLVFTHRDKINRVTVRKRICDFKDSVKSRLIASTFEDRIYIVAFPPIEDIRDGYKDQLLKEIPIDIDRLRRAISNAREAEPLETILPNKCVIL